jgi:hypothetical protein
MSQNIDHQIGENDAGEIHFRRYNLKTANIPVHLGGLTQEHGERHIDRGRLALRLLKA